MTTPEQVLDFPNRRIGRQIWRYASVDSTNTLAIELSRTGDPAEQHGLAILADSQTAGRGQYGRVWDCPASRGVLLSVILHLPSELRRPVILAAWAAVAVGDTILSLTQRQAGIKWPNDVLVNRRKVCGILIEQAQAVVIGIGLNVRQTPEELAHLPNAAALCDFTSELPPTFEVALGLLQHLDSWYDELSQGCVKTLESCWKWRVGLLGRSVIVEKTDGSTLAGRLTDLTFSGADLMSESGERVRVVPEAIRHLSEGS